MGNEAILSLPKNPYLYLSHRVIHFLAFFHFILILGSTSVLFIQTQISCFVQIPVCPVHRQIWQILLVAFLVATCLTSQLLFWFFLIELFGVCPPCASGEAVPCEVILANEIGWEIFLGGEKFWGMFL